MLNLTVNLPVVRSFGMIRYCWREGLVGNTDRGGPKKLITAELG